VRVGRHHGLALDEWLALSANRKPLLG